VTALLESSRRTVQRQESASGSRQAGASAPEVNLPREPWLVPPEPLPHLPLDIPLGENLMNWHSFDVAFHQRGLTLGAGDREIIVEHWQRWFPLATLVARRLSMHPADLMNLSVVKTIDLTFAGENPDLFERVKIDDAKSGISTRTLILKTWHFR
jgi:hypothetical protein